MVGAKKPRRRSVSKAKPVLRATAQSKSASKAPSQQRVSSIPTAQAKGVSGKRVTKKPSVSSSSRTGIRWPQFIFIFLLLAVVVSAGLFVWDRWFRFNDLQDFQGLWSAEQTATSVTIDNEKIELSSEVEYFYTLDTWGKTISYTFGELEGLGTYRFSPDRKKLVIIEGGTDDWILFIKIALGISEAEEGTESDTTTILLKQEGSLSDGRL